MALPAGAYRIYGIAVDEDGQILISNPGGGGGGGGEVTIADGQEVGLAAGSEVLLADGSLVGLVPGTEVGITGTPTVYSRNVAATSWQTLDNIVNSTPGTPVVCSDTSIPCVAVWVIAVKSNSDDVSIVSSASITDAAQNEIGVSLAPGQDAVIEIDNPNKVFMDSIVSGDQVSVQVLVP